MDEPVEPTQNEPSTSANQPQPINIPPPPQRAIPDICLEFICHLGKNPAVTNVTIDQVVTGASELISSSGSAIKNDVVSSMQSLGSNDNDIGHIESVITEKFSETTRLLDGLCTSRHREQLLASHGLYTVPKKFNYEAPTLEDAGSSSSISGEAKAVYETGYTIDIKATLVGVLSQPSIQENLIWPNDEQCHLLRHCFDGNHVKQLYRQIGKPFLVVELFYDDIDPGNALGAKASVNKIGLFYICLKNLPAYFNSSGSNIHLAAVGYSGDFKIHGYEAIVEKLWIQYAELERHGIDVDLTKGTLTGKHNLPVGLGNVIGDNLAVHQALGLKQSFMSHKFCRFWLISNLIRLKFRALNQDTNTNTTLLLNL